MKRLMLLIGILLLVGLASAMTIEGSDYTGTINFFDNGVAVANIDGYPQTMFSWEWVSGNDYRAHWLWYAIDFTYVDGVVASSSFPGARLV
jgi:hypothetical protein